MFPAPDWMDGTAWWIMVAVGFVLWHLVAKPASAAIVARGTNWIADRLGRPKAPPRRRTCPPTPSSPSAP